MATQNRTRPYLISLIFNTSADLLKPWVLYDNPSKTYFFVRNEETGREKKIQYSKLGIFDELGRGHGTYTVDFNTAPGVILNTLEEGERRSNPNPQPTPSLPLHSDQMNPDTAYVASSSNTIIDQQQAEALAQNGEPVIALNNEPARDKFKVIATLMSFDNGQLNPGQRYEIASKSKKVLDLPPSEQYEQVRKIAADILSRRESDTGLAKDTYPTRESKTLIPTFVNRRARIRELLQDDE